MIKIDKEAFLKALKPLMTGLPDKSISGAEDLVSVSVTATGTMTVIICNSRCEMVNVIPCISKEDCAFLVDAKLLNNTIASIPDGELKIKLITNEQTNSVVSIAISSVNTSRKYKLVCPGIDGFYSWPENTATIFEFSIPIRDLAEKLRIASLNVDKKDIVEAFSNISFFSDDNGMLMITTGNSSMLGFIKTGIESKEKFILPPYSAKYLSTFTEIDKCFVTITSNRFCLKYGDFSLKTTLIDGKVPNYPILLKQYNVEKSITISKNVLAEALRIHSAYSDSLHSVRLTCDESTEMTVRSGDPGNNEVVETIEIQNNQNCDFKVAVNCSFLRMAVSAIKDERVRIATSGSDYTIPLFVSSENENGDILWMMGRLKV